MQGDYKEVFFNIYCEKCKHEHVKANHEPCCDCISVPFRIDSHKPEKFESK